MHSLWLTGRLISRALWNGISNVASAAEPGGRRGPEPQLVSAVCGFSKDRRARCLVRGQFGDDAWFTAKYMASDVLGKAGGSVSRTDGRGKLTCLAVVSGWRSVFDCFGGRCGRFPN